MTKWPLTGRILHKKEKHYEDQKLDAAVKEVYMKLAVVLPHAVELLVTGAGRRSVRVHGDDALLSDCIMPRTESGTT